MSKTYWHGYVAKVPEMADEPEWSGVTALTVFETAEPELEPTIKGRVFGFEMLFIYATTWDHPPTKEEKDAFR